MIPRDSELLRHFCRERSESAIAPLVQRHLDLVYAAALRRAGDNMQIAERITRTVFSDLAAQAKSLPADVSLAGWLYSRAKTAEIEPRSPIEPAREGESPREPQKRPQPGDKPGPGQAPLSSAGSKNSDRLEPLIGEAIEKMEEGDRTALLLHYRDGLDFHTVGAVLGMTDGQARQRIKRGLDGLRAILREGGLTSPTTLQALGTHLSAAGLVKPPPGLARSIASQALVKTGAASRRSSFWRSNRMKAALAALCVVAAMTALIFEKRWPPFNATKSALADRSAEARNRQSANLSADSSELQGLREDQRDRLRLRAQLAALRKKPGSPARGGLSVAAGGRPAKPQDDASVVTYFVNASVKLAPGQTMMSGGWTTVSGKRGFLLVTPEIAEGDGKGKEITFETVWAEGPDDVLAELGLESLFTDSRTISAAQLLSEAETRSLMTGLIEGAGVDVLTAPSITTKEGVSARVDGRMSKTEGEATVQVGPSVELTPAIKADGTLDLVVHAQFSEMNRIEPEPVEAEPEPDPLALDPDEEDTDEP